MQEDVSRPEANPTLKRRPRGSKSQPNGSDFTLQESSTVKRRPKSRDKEPDGFAELAAANGEPAGTAQPNTTQPVAFQNGTATMKRRPASDAGVTEQPEPQPQPQPQYQSQVAAASRRNSVEQAAPGSTDGGAVRKPKPPVSPKPIVAQIKRQGGPQTPPHSASNKSIPLPGPGTPGSPGTQTLYLLGGGGRSGSKMQVHQARNHISQICLGLSQVEFLVCVRLSMSISGRKEDTPACLTQAGSPAHCSQTSQACPLHDQPLLSEHDHGPSSSQAAFSPVPPDQLTSRPSPDQYPQPSQRQAAQSVFSEPPHPSDTNDAADAPDSCHSQPYPSTCKAPSLLHRGCVCR